MNRRTFLADTGMGFTGLALSAMLQRDGIARAEEEAWRPPDGKPHFKPKAKTVVWFFMIGGTSHMESFDPKPELTRHAGKTIAQSPYKSTLDSPFVKQNVREVVAGLHKVQPTIYPLQTGFKKYGQSGLEISDWWPHVGSCADDLAVVLVLGTPLADCCGGMNGHGGNYLGPEHAGVRMNVDPRNPLPFAAPSGGKSREDQAREFDLLGRLNRLTAVEYPDDAALRARIKSYELAFRMQSAVPEVFQFETEDDETKKLYGMDQTETRPFGQTCLSVRRLVERGVRFIQVFHGYDGGAGAWDAHGGLKAGHTKLSGQVDKPIAGLLKDLKRRGLLDETLVVWGTEFGRTPGAQGSDGRDHHPFGFCGWLAGGGVKGGIAHGATDELGFHAVEKRHYITDLHATVLHQMGLDARRLEVPGRKRLELDFGKPITEILA
jgi:hypothetical protein